jgi:hypothetical protein
MSSYIVVRLDHEELPVALRDSPELRSERLECIKDFTASELRAMSIRRAKGKHRKVKPTLIKVTDVITKVLDCLPEGASKSALVQRVLGEVPR